MASTIARVALGVNRVGTSGSILGEADRPTFAESGLTRAGAYGDTPHMAPPTAPAAPQLPDLIDFRLGHPGATLLPFDEIAVAAGSALAQRDPSVLQYGQERGSFTFRRQLAELVASIGGGNVDPDRLFVTSGISQSLDLLTTLYSQPGDVVLVEEPSYHLAKLIFRDHGLKQVGVASDAEGLVPEALEAALEANPNARLLYLVPTFGNPTGALLGSERSRRVVELAERHDVMVLADEVYRFLNFANEPPLGFSSFESERVVSLNSFSKVLAPGLRLGWLQATESVLERVECSGLLQSGGGLNPLAAATVGEALSSGVARRHLLKLRRVYAERCQALSEALREQLPAASFVTPGGGYFVWLQLPRVRSEELLSAALAAGVAYVPGERFSTSGQYTDHLRLSFAYHNSRELSVGAERLAQAVQSHRSTPPPGA